MSNKLFIFFLIFTLSFYYTFESEELEANSKLVIIKADGELREYQRQQIITLTIVPSTKMNPKNLTNLEFTKDGKNYKPKTKCFEAANKYYETLVKCELDLGELSHGNYIISSFNYKNKNYPSKAKIEILKPKKKVSDIKLLNVKASYNLIEYRKRQSIKFLFDLGVDYEKINYIEVQSDSGKKYNINTQCNLYGNPERCEADFFIKGGKYKIIYVSYGEEIITSDEDLFFDVQENIIKLKNAYNFFWAPISNSRHSIISFYFDENCDNDYGYFTKFSFTNVKTGKTYDSYDFRRVYGSTGFGNSENFIFDLHKLPPGEYYINYVYKLRSYNTKFKINIEPVKTTDLSKIYQDQDLSEIYQEQDLED